MDKKEPLAYRIRPKNIGEVIGQEHILAKDKPLRLLIDENKIPSSLIFWGPPGCGKTTLARIISNSVGYNFVELSAVKAGKADIERAINSGKLFDKKTILFIDEIHRFNKAQQDFLLPFVESGRIILVGATTENPSFEIISPLLSRSRVFVLKELSELNILSIINRALSHPLGIRLDFGEENKRLIANLSNGDARTALNILEFLSSLGLKEVNREIILDSVQKTLRYDKNSEEHYNIISAVHKSLRDSDVQASVYWTMRMIEAGEDPEYIIRRLIRFASEDIGNADPNALNVAVNAMQAVRFLGYPECNTSIIQCVTYLANAPKSNKVYEAVNRAKEVINKTGNLGVPLNLRNAPTPFMKEQGYGDGYKYAHDFKDAKVLQERLPPEIKNEIFYEPTDRGFEKEIKKRMDEFS